jgi:hypothetical protein
MDSIAETAAARSGGPGWLKPPPAQSASCGSGWVGCAAGRQPGAAAIGAAGAAAGAHPSLAGIIAAGVAGNVAGSYLAWAAGLYWGQAAVGRWGRRVGLREHDIDRANRWFDRHRSAAVFFGLYRFRTRRSGCDLRFGWISRLGQDRGLCLFASCT